MKIAAIKPPVINRKYTLVHSCACAYAMVYNALLVHTAARRRYQTSTEGLGVQGLRIKHVYE